MKTYKHLYPQICAFQNLRSAFWKARRHKSAKPDVAAFEFDLERNLLQLEEELLRSSRVRDPASLSAQDAGPRPGDFRLKHGSETSFERNVSAIGSVTCAKVYPGPTLCSGRVREPAILGAKTRVRHQLRAKC